ncbi:site-specific DNA-methyltransferase [Salmonella enterica]|nr:site-specific DNA-methyltransferase [Salmonella enterica]EAV0976289.1 site-specific DNA-methyltransferase [Salmonella enterica]EBB4036201.1 site-specific DNA-methyltransferase [Salmonella enterica]EBH7934846.1 site-specific DNA-methyltransferase [Salmonella enterica subsp. enterica serovar Rubislaw]
MIQLHCGDCLEVMPKIPAGCVDLVLCDPPYGTIKGLSVRGWSEETTAWDSAIAPEKLFSLCERVLRANGALVLFAQEPYTSQLITRAHGNLPFSYRLVWKKEHFANPLTVRKAPVSLFEDVLVFFKKYDSEKTHPLRAYSRRVLEFIGLRSCTAVNRVLGHRRAEHFFQFDTLQFGLCTRETYNELISCFGLELMPGFLTYDEIIAVHRRISGRVFNLPPGQKYKPNVLEYRRERERHHPTQKPVALLEDLICTYSNPGNTVLDFAMGSGSTGVACVNTGRRFTGIEKVPEYFDTALARIDGAGMVRNSADWQNIRENHKNLKE